LLREYVEHVAAHGVNCTEVSCGNPRLLEYVLQNAPSAGVPTPLIQKAREAFEGAMKEKVEAASQRMQEFARTNDAKEQQLAGGNTPSGEKVSGYRMEEQRRDTPASNDVSGDARPEWLRTLAWALPLLALLAIWRRSRRGMA
jgi:cobalamin biosynthesis Mg chelatase CobN